MFSICDFMLQWVHTKATKLGFDVIIGRTYSDFDRTHLFDTMTIYPRVKHPLAISKKVIADALSTRVVSIQLVIVINGWLLCSLKIYEWPMTILNRLYICIRNFLWTYNIDTRKHVSLLEWNLYSYLWR